MVHANQPMKMGDCTTTSLCKICWAPDSVGDKTFWGCFFFGTRGGQRVAGEGSRRRCEWLTDLRPGTFKLGQFDKRLSLQRKKKGKKFVIFGSQFQPSELADCSARIWKHWLGYGVSVGNAKCTSILVVAITGGPFSKQTRVYPHTLEEKNNRIEGLTQFEKMERRDRST